MKISDTKKQQESAWAPFQYPIFRMLWIASLVSSIGTWMQDVGSGWLMTSLTKDPFMVASIQATTSFAMFLLVLPSGALADIVDRRRYLILLQSLLMVAAGALACTTFLDKTSPEFLLFMTFCLGSGAALSLPAWIALMSELVNAKHLPYAVVLTSVSISISRAMGPALAGIIIAASGPAAVFAINALSFLGIIIVLKLSSIRKTSVSSLPAERLYGAMRAGLRYVGGSPSSQIVLIKACGFFIFASGVWALLPLIARMKLQGGPLEYGLLLALLGFGAVIGAAILPYLRQALTCDQRILLGAVGFSITTFILALSDHLLTACCAITLGGLSWTTVFSTLATLVQQIVPTWVRARVISIYYAIVFGSMSLGSLMWGWIGTHYSIGFALVCAASGMLFINFLTYFIVSGENLITDHTPSNNLPFPMVEEEPKYEAGPVMVMVEYLVDRGDVANFTKAIKGLRRIRLRDGAFFWILYKDVENPTRLVECFMTESWVEHLRQHERMSVSDWKVQDKISAFHKGEKPPIVTHFVAHS